MSSPDNGGTVKWASYRSTSLLNVQPCQKELRQVIDGRKKASRTFQFSWSSSKSHCTACWQYRKPASFPSTEDLNIMSSSVSSILEGLAVAQKAFEKDEAGAREALIDRSRALVSALEIPSEFIQRTFWAEVSSLELLSASILLTMCNSLRNLPSSGSLWTSSFSNT